MIKKERPKPKGPNGSPQLLMIVTMICHAGAHVLSLFDPDRFFSAVFKVSLDFWSLK